MRLTLIGGRLQGLEAAYLAKKADITTVLIDREPNTPASTIVDEHYIFDVMKQADFFKKLCKTVDAVLPTTENMKTLIFLEKTCEELGIPFLQDNDAFWITSNKTRSKNFLTCQQIEVPRPWPNATFPLIVKPARLSGSISVRKVSKSSQLSRMMEEVRQVDQEIIIEEFIEGLAVSLEVLAMNGNPIAFQITDLEFDESYGCKRVTAPTVLPNNIKTHFLETGAKIAKDLKLHGLTDIQSIVTPSNSLKTNEINARLPSQTPTVVFHSTGINIVEELANMFLEHTLSLNNVSVEKGVVYQHVCIHDRSLKVQGEHIMTDAKNLMHELNFFGTDEAITNFFTVDANEKRVATLIVREKTLEEAQKKLDTVVSEIMSEFKLTQYIDPKPK
ncbi:MAG: 3-methylornithine--L-lysine ligase PylC [Promethearchaeota archaeon]